jgi:hypothetical protein
MRPLLNLRIVLLLAGALLLGAGARAQAPLPAGKSAAFAVPKMAHPPTIDGIIEPMEWREALAIGGLASQNPGGNLLIMRPTTYYLAWDAANLYVACRTWLMPGYKPHVKGRAPGAVTAFDDGMEFNLQPMGANLPEGNLGNAYKFFISCFGSDGDFGRVSVGQIFRNWRPTFQRAVRQTAPGSGPLGGSWWEAEMIFPAKDFELVGPNRAGDVWKMLLAFNHIPIWMQAAVPMSSSYFDGVGWPKMTLVENAPAVQVTMDELPGLKDGTAAAKIAVYNPTAVAVTVKVLAQIEEWKDAKTPTEVLNKDTALTVLPGKTGEVRLSEALPRDLGKNKGGLYFNISQGERELYRYYAYFQLGYPENWVKYTPPKEAYPLSVKFNPLRGKLLLDADCNYIARPELAKALHYTITREGEAKPVLAEALTDVKQNLFEALLQMPELTPGKYTLATTMELADGTRLGPETQGFQKRDEAKVFAAWWKNTIGDTERIIPPFTAMSVKGSTVGVWGRSYALNALGLPNGITSQDKSVLAAPARIVVVVGGKEHTIKLDGKLRITEKKAWRVSFTGAAAGAGLQFTTTGCVEQDGLAQINLTYAPAGKAPIQVEALRLEFPLADQEAQVMNSMGPGGNFATLWADLVPKTQGLLWSTLQMGQGGSGMTVGTFYPDVWVGNEARGFYWWADSDQGWVPDDKLAAHELIREARDGQACVVLRNNIIGTPYTLTAPRTLTFSYNATPFKPFPKGWRAAINAEDGTFSGPHKQYKDSVTGKSYDGTQMLGAPAAPADWARVWGEFKVQADKKVRDMQPFDPLSARRAAWVHNSLAITGYGARSTDWTVENYFRPEWDENTMCATQQDYDLWLAKRAFSEGGLRSIYWDIFFIRPWSGEINGMAYKLPDGRVQPTFNGMNLRRHSMRLASLQEELGLAPGGVSVHSTNCFPFVAYPWIGAGLDGEHNFLTDATTRDWVDFYPPARMRALNTPQNYGVPLTWMSVNHITDPVKRGKVWRGFYDWTRFHDCNWYGWDGYKPGDKLLDFGLNDARLQYVPHWRNTAITSDDPTVLVAYWQLPSRVIAMAFNHDGQAVKNPVLKVDFAKLGLTGGAIALSELRGVDTRNGQSQKPEADPTPVLDGTAQTVTVTELQPHTARYFGLRAEEPAAIARVKQELAGLGAELTPAMLDWGLAAKATTFLPAAAVKSARCADPAVQLALWQQADRVLLAVKHTGAKALAVTLDLDLDGLGLVPQLPWQEFVRARDFTGGSAQLKFYERQLVLGTVKPGAVRLIGVRRY